VSRLADAYAIRAKGLNWNFRIISGQRVITVGSNNMAYSKSENQVAVSTLFVNLIISVVFCFGLAVSTRAQDAQRNGSDGSWTATTDTSVKNAIPSRTTESHAKSGDRSVDKQRVEVLGPNGGYQPDSETETETVRVDATTTRTVVRNYKWDGNGQRKLAQVTEEEVRSTASGDAQTVRTTSNSDANGSLQVVQRETADTRKTSPDVQETKTTVYLADGNGGFTTSRQTQELQKRSADNRLEEKKTTLLPDGNGGWKVGEVTEKTIQEDGKNRTTEERVSRPADLDGRLSEFSRTVGEETETSTGEKSNTVDTYSTENPGVAGDGRLHLNQRVTTVQKKNSDGETTEQRVELSNAGNPSDGRQVRAKTKYTVLYGASGTQQTKTVQVLEGDGNLDVISVDTRKSDQAPPSTQTPSDKKPQ
jgi:hypothetical protein